MAQAQPQESEKKWLSDEERLLFMMNGI